MNAYPVVRFLAPIVVAAVLGPLVVSVSLGFVDVVSYLFGPASSATLADERGMLVFYVIMAYFIGGPIALLAGLFVSLWMIRRPPNALVVNAAALIATVSFMGVAATGLLGPVEETNGRSNFSIMLAAAVFAANICWLLMRRFVRPSHTGFPSNSRPNSN